MTQQTINIHPSVMEKEMSAMIEFLRNRSLGNAQLAFTLSMKLRELDNQIKEGQDAITEEGGASSGG